MNQAKLTQGFALMTVVVLVIVMMALATAYFFLTNLELSTTRASASSTTGFYAAEAGLNVRGEEIRAKFQGGDRPTGKVFSVGNACKTTADYTPQNSIDSFYCRDYSLNGRKVVTYVVQDPANTDPTNERRTVTLQAPDTFAGLNAIEYRYEVLSESYPPNETRPEARLGMVFRSRLIPVFQFAAFYDKDLEMAPGANMTLNGRVHVNGDLYLESGAGSTLDITGKITVATSKREGAGGGNLYRGRKDSTNTCGGTVRINDAKGSTTPENEPPLSCIGRKSQERDLTPTWGEQIQTQMDTITAPDMASFDIGGEAWNQADLRVALDMRTGSSTYLQVIVPDRTVPLGNPELATANLSMTNKLESCKANMTGANAARKRPYTLATTFSGSNNQVRAVEGSQSFYDRRENYNVATSQQKPISMLEIDTRQLLDCLRQHRNHLFDQSNSIEKDLDDTSQGGLVIYLTVLGRDGKSERRDPIVPSGFGVRVRNGAKLSATQPNAPEIKGLTIVSDQALYVMGDYNRDEQNSTLRQPGDKWKPASFLVDSLNVLSNNWDQEGYDSKSRANLGDRKSTTTQINAAFLAGTTSTGGIEGSSGQNRSKYNGGLENYPRFHEDWIVPNVAFHYLGSFVSLDKPVHVKTDWPGTGAGANVYNAPTRRWGYDVRFNDPEQLPPLAPRFVYLRQELFSRNFTR